MLRSSASLASSRALSVLAGTDVFGRGTYGGGGFNSAMAALEAMSCGLSAALFAPAWTLESFAKGNATLAAIADLKLWHGWQIEQVTYIH